MLPAKIRRVVICGHKVDFRKQWNGLLAESRRLGFDPYDGDMMVFVKRDKRQLRALCGDDRGLYLFSRRFEGGCLKFLFGHDHRTISVSELGLWFVGAHYTVHNQAPPWR